MRHSLPVSSYDDDVYSKNNDDDDEGDNNDDDDNVDNDDDNDNDDGDDDGGTPSSHVSFRFISSLSVFRGKR